MSEELERVLDEGDPDRSLPYNAVDKSATKAEAAVTLAMMGASPTDIAKTLNYSSAYRAARAVERALASAANDPLEREQMRKLIGKRLDRLLSAVMGNALDPNNPNQLAFHARALAVVDRQAKLYGADAPLQVQVNAADEQILAFVEMVSPNAAADKLAIEADPMADEDIVDAEVIDGES
jgi:phosphoglycolate phosphatase-like HAD superfamily hydrolase